VYERYGRQQGALRGPNPRKPGRPSHHPLVAVLAEAHFLLYGWLRSENCGTARGVMEFLKEALAMLPEKHAIRVVRADAGGVQIAHLVGMSWTCVVSPCLFLVLPPMHNPRNWERATRA